MGLPHEYLLGETEHHIMAAAKFISVSMPDGNVRTFESLSEACAAFDVPLKRAHKRLTYFCWPPEQALEIVPREERVRPITIIMGDGTPRYFDSLRRASVVLGVPYLIAYKRLDRKWSAEQAFGIQPPPKERALRPSESSSRPTVKVSAGRLLLRRRQPTTSLGQ